MRQLSQTGAFQGAVMAGAMVVAGGFDALVNILSGRLLGKEQFAVFVAVTAVLQIVVHLTNVIRNVTAYYTAELTVQPDSTPAIQTFLRRNWRWAWRWGLVATAAALLVSPSIARFMHIDSPWPLFAASFALLMLFVRPVTDGTLQGIQQFIGLGTVQVLQSGAAPGVCGPTHSGGPAGVRGYVITAIGNDGGDADCRVVPTSLL